MQTFYPFEDQNKTFACLDYKRIGKQRVEGYQILRTLASEFASYADIVDYVWPV